MKVLAITSALLIALSSAAAITPVPSTNEAGLEARDAGMREMRRWGNFKYSRKYHNGFKKRDADADARWGNFQYSRKYHNGLKKRDADADADARWGNFQYSRKYHNGFKKRDVDNKDEDLEDDEIITWPADMTLEELKEAVDGMVEDEKVEKAEKAEV